MRRHSFPRVVALLTITASVSAGTLVSTPIVHASSGLEPYYAQSLQWSACDDHRECSTLLVPIDYSSPSSGDFRLALSRARAKGTKVGSIVVNPGGPGADGTSFAEYAQSSLGAQVARSYDVIGFDPRGVGKSAPVTCLTGRQTTAWLRADATPDTPAEVASYARLAAGIGRGCLQYTPTRARNVGSEATVRDMDILRAALDEKKLNFLGYSYGTYLGALYAHDFPANVGRFVLDGAVDPSLDSMQVSEGQSRAFQFAMTRFARSCARLASCPYPGNATRVLAGINALLARLDLKPMRTDKRETLTQSQALGALFWGMYSRDYWPNLRDALSEAKRGNGTYLLMLSDLGSDRTGPNTYASNQTSAFYAISCWDSPAAPGSAGLASAARDWSTRAPVPEMARAMAWGNAPCSTWFGHSDTPPAPASSDTDAPILVIGTTYDPATPYPWAVALADQLSTARLITFVGDGHTAFGNGNDCIDSAVNDFLASGIVPARGTRCT
ncbi:MAG: alpha/beta hydrolase [Candidatus Nanopelagicales bacterium]